jgi:hypothetical protein
MKVTQLLKNLKQPPVLEKISTIKACMATFTLSPINQPKWAINVDEVKWKQHLLEKIHTTDKK